MGSGNIHCINCGAETAEESGRAKCSACGAEFGFARIEAEENGGKAKLDRYCVAAGALSLVSCAFPLIAAAAIVLAVVGLRRVRRTGARGGKHAVEAIVLSIIGIGAFSVMAPRMYAARAHALDATCKANLTSVGQFILFYENEYRGPRGYTLEDVAKHAEKGGYRPVFSCPDAGVPSGGKPAPTYVMLTSLEPISGIADPAHTVIAFELHAHHVPASEGFPEMNHINALFADGHVEGLPVEKAAGIIEKSLLAERRKATTRPGK